MIGRNQLCLCGSGIKSKRCCESPIKQAERKQAENERIRQVIRKRREEFLKTDLTKTLPINMCRLNTFALMVPFLMTMSYRRYEN